MRKQFTKFKKPVYKRDNDDRGAKNHYSKPKVRDFLKDFELDDRVDTERDVSYSHKASY